MTEECSYRFTALNEYYVGYEVYHSGGEKIGKVDDLFIDENDQPEYVRVKTGLFGLKSTLISDLPGKLHATMKETKFSDTGR